MDAAATAILNFNLELQIEILGHDPVIRDIAVAGRLFTRGFTDNHAVLNAPDGRVADPILQRLAIEYGDETRVIVKSDRVRFAKAAGVSPLGRRLLGCRGKYHEREYRRLCRLE